MTTTNTIEISAAIAQREAATARTKGTATKLTDLRFTRNWEEALVEGKDATSAIMFSVPLRPIAELESYLPDAGRARYLNLRITDNGLWVFMSHKAVTGEARMGLYSMGDIASLVDDEHENGYTIRARGSVTVQFGSDSSYQQLELRVKDNMFSLWAIKA